MSEDSAGDFFHFFFLVGIYFFIRFLRFYLFGPGLPLSTHFFYIVLLTFLLLEGLGSL